MVSTVARVFMLSKNGVFAQGLECLLRRQPGIEIVGQATDVDAAIDQIRKLKPSTILVANGEPELDPGLIMARMSFAGMNLQVIGLDLDSNTLVLCRREERFVRRVEDLIGVISADGAEQVGGAVAKN